MADYEPDDERNILVRELRVIEFLDGEGDPHTVDLSQGLNGAELEESDYMDMVAWALAYGLAEKVAAILESRAEE